MLVKEIMVRAPATVHVDQPLAEAAIRMHDAEIGVLFVVDGDELVGAVTDRDIAIRGIAEGREPGSTSIIEVMTRHVVFCREDESVCEAGAIMLRQKVRRLAVIDASREIVGVLSLSDLARAEEAEKLDSTASAELLRAIAQPTSTAKAPGPEDPTGGRRRGSPPGVLHVYAPRPCIHGERLSGES